jgi:hypothetical protein
MIFFLADQNEMQAGLQIHETTLLNIVKLNSPKKLKRNQQPVF